eukprot:1195759-Prorocentrum_minimum.AAC.4
MSAAFARGATWPPTCPRSIPNTASPPRAARSRPFVVTTNRDVCKLGQKKDNRFFKTLSINPVLYDILDHSGLHDTLDHPGLYDNTRVYVVSV